MKPAIIPPYRWPRKALGERVRCPVEIEPLFMECVAFLCEERKGKPGGTAFFVEVEEHGRAWTYIVTASHNLDEIYGQDVFVRVNTHPGKSDEGFDDIPTRKSDWIKHDTADVATIISPIDRSKFLLQRLPMDLFINRNYRLDTSILVGKGNPVLEPVLKETYKEGIPVKVGHDVFSPGLFVQSAGKNRNLPVVRFGNVSRMPHDELIVLETEHSKRSIRAYLAETHSWGGFSGSPMFWHFQYNMAMPISAVRLGPGWDKPKSKLLIEKPIPPVPTTVMVGVGFIIGLLGLVSGHFDIAKKAKKEDIETEINAGMAVITPAENIRELLMENEDVLDDRRKHAAKETPIAATGDSVFGSTQTLPKTKEVIPVPTRRKFQSDLSKAIRKKKR
jgi:hypothetical protein